MAFNEMSMNTNYVDARTPEERANEPKSVTTYVSSMNKDTLKEKGALKKEIAEECHCSKTSRYHTIDSNYEHHTPQICWREKDTLKEREEYNMPSIEKDGHNWIRVVDHLNLIQQAKEERDKEIVEVIKPFLDKAEQSYKTAVSDQVAPYRHQFETLLEIINQLSNTK